MDFLRLTLELIDFLAWPVLALGYPLCASIRAIETGSKYHMRKLVTYWTIFSFISLFEHVFERLIGWVPLWPYIKLITICWLVIPQFNGACYFYQHLIHPRLPLKLLDLITQFYGSCYVYRCLLYLCLSVNIQTVTDWFNKPMEDLSLKNETFLAVAERFLEENGSDTLENLIANKSKDYGLNNHAEDIKTIETSDEAVKLTSNQVKSVMENPIKFENKTTGTQVKEMVVSADAEVVKLSDTSGKQVQTEWTCSPCRVTTTSENSLKSHLNRRKHKAKSEGLKTCKQTAKSEETPPVTESILVNQEQGKHAAAAQPEHSANEAALKQDFSMKKNPICIEKKITGVQVKKMAVPADAEEIKLPETNSSKKVQIEWTCAVCQVKTSSDHDLKCHLLGRKHRETCEVLKKTYKKIAKYERNLTCTSNTPNLKQDQVSDARKKHRANEIPKEMVHPGTTGNNEKQKQVKNAGAASHNPKLWCSFCNVRCPGEIDMAAHLNGRKHLEKLQETSVTNFL